ncbi:MAG: zf-TFIIB domain-containing protein [bacterium]
MLCPRCLANSKEVELQNAVLENIELDVCNSCGGIWFDKQELASAVSLDKQTVDNFYNKLSNLKSTNSESNNEGNSVEKTLNKDVILKCPKCNIEMSKYRYMYTSNIYIDSCDKCEGIWLDNKELLNIINYIEEASKVDPEKEAAILAKIQQIKKEYELKEKEFVDSLVKMDDKARNPIIKGLGEVLQAIYSFLYKRGL